MKYLVTSFLMVVSNFSYACFVNGEAQRVASEFVQAPENVHLALTDQIDDWSEIMGGYIYFEKNEKKYTGYIRFDQNNCRAIFSDIKELDEVE